MSLSRIQMKNPPQNLKRFMYIKQEFLSFLDECSGGEHSLSDVWMLTATTNHQDTINRLFGRGNVEREEDRDLNKHVQSDVLVRDIGYGSLDTDEDNTDENPVDMKLKETDLLICALTSDSTMPTLTFSDKDILLMRKAKTLFPAAPEQKNLILYVDTCNDITQLAKHGVIKILEEADSTFALQKGSIKTSTAECLECIAEKLESNLITEMLAVKRKLESEQGVYDLHDVNSTTLDRLIDICQRPVMKSEVPLELRKFLTSDQSGVKGFGVHHNKFLIHLYPGTSKDKRDQALEEAVKYYSKESIDIIQSENQEFIVPHCYGCGEKMTRQNSQSGSIGFCCKMETENGTMKTVIITSSHVLNEKEKVYMNIEGESVEVGNCIYSPNEGAMNIPSLVDIAVVEINENNENNFHTKVMDKEREKQDFQISEKECDQYTQVWKHGATSGLTTGIVTSPKFEICMKNGTRFVSIIEGQSKPFSDPGDSGASVLFQEKEGIFALSVIIGQGSPDKHPPDESSKRNCFTAILNSAIQRFESERKAKLHITSPR